MFTWTAPCEAKPKVEVLVGRSNAGLNADLAASRIETFAKYSGRHPGSSISQQNSLLGFYQAYDCNFFGQLQTCKEI